MESNRKILEEIISKGNLKVSTKSGIYINITADVNDADYIRDTYEVDAEYYYELVKTLDKLDGDWSNRDETLTEEEIDFLSDYIPYMDNEEVHTIEDYSFKIYLDGVLYE